VTLTRRGAWVVGVTLILAALVGFLLPVVLPMTGLDWRP
jgi:hypothetical protein